MAVRLGVFRAGRQSAQAIASHSRAALDRTLARPAELWVAIAEEDARLLGAFQRGAGFARAGRLLRRGSGGPDVLLAEGTIHVALALAHPAALVPADARRLVNRLVRPLLRALTKSGAGVAHFFGRDWVSLARRPAAWVGFAHDAGEGRALFEAFVGVRAPFAPSGRASFRGASPGSLEAIAGRTFDPALLCDAIVEAYAEGADAEAAVLPPLTASAPAEDPTTDRPWAATAEEAIGTIGAGPDARGVFRVGGDLLVSRDALAALEARAASAPLGDMGRLVDATLGAPGVALDGVRSLESVRSVIVRALSPGRAPRSGR
ncbi:MAG: hypothetical protein JOZ69_06840 [Myxococcales bacterium]|nr:hypothetical protein [Myxococcales bacterium]